MTDETQFGYFGCELRLARLERRVAMLENDYSNLLKRLREVLDERLKDSAHRPGGNPSREAR